jgi:hypothetical protein
MFELILCGKANALPKVSSASMALTVEQQARRRFKITASMLPILMHGDEARINRLYCEEIGEIEREPSNYAMELGSHVEPFMLDWTQAKTGHPIIRRGEVVDHPTIPEFCCTLDGYRAFDDAVIENKFLRWGQPKEEFVPYYYPQLLAQMRCVGATRGVLHIGQATSEPVEYEITPDVLYEEAMWARVEEFRLCLRTFTPPFPMPKKVPVDQFRTVDLAQDPMPNWGHVLLPLLQIYEHTREAADEHDKCGKEARALVPDDVNVVVAPEHKLTRDRRGVISIRRTA